MGELDRERGVCERLLPATNGLLLHQEPVAQRWCGRLAGAIVGGLDRVPGSVVQVQHAKFR